MVFPLDWYFDKQYFDTNTASTYCQKCKVQVLIKFVCFYTNVTLLTSISHLLQASVMLVQCVSIEILRQPASQSDVDPVCVPIELVNILQPASTQCDVDPVCVHKELLSTIFNLPLPTLTELILLYTLTELY